MSRTSDPPLRPLAERSAEAILAAVVDLFQLLRVAHAAARGELFVICDRGSISKAGVVATYIDYPLPLREASELLTWTLRGYGCGHSWRWRLCLCPTGERTRAGIHVLLMKPPSPPARSKPRRRSREQSGGSTKEGPRKPRASARRQTGASRVPTGDDAPAQEQRAA